MKSLIEQAKIEKAKSEISIATMNKKFGEESKVLINSLEKCLFDFRERTGISYKLSDNCPTPGSIGCHLYIRIELEVRAE